MYNSSNFGNFNIIVKHNSLIENVNIIITDMFGRKVLEKQRLTFAPNQAHPITISQLSKGVYLLHFNHNQKNIIKRVVIN